MGMYIEDSEDDEMYREGKLHLVVEHDAGPEDVLEAVEAVCDHAGLDYEELEDEPDMHLFIGKETADE